MTKVVKDLRELGPALGMQPKPKQDKPPFWDKKALSIRLDRVLAFIKNYQLTHGNASPPINVLMDEMEESEEAVRFWTNKLEANGDILIINHRPFSVLVKTKPIPLTDARRADNALKSGGAGGWETTTPKQRFEIVEGARMRLAEFIGQYWADHEKGPTYKEMGTVLGTSNTQLIHSAVTNLADRGIVTHSDEPRSTKLTASGEDLFGGKKKVHGPSTDPSVLEKKYRAIHQYMLDHQKSHGHPPSYADIASRFGYANSVSISNVVMQLAKRGLFKHNEKYSTRSQLRYQKGRAVEVDAQAQAPVAEKTKAKRAKAGKRMWTHGKGLQNVAEALNNYFNEHGFFPNSSELARYIGHRGMGPVPALKKMEELGYLKPRPKHSHAPHELTALGREKLLPKAKEQVPDGIEQAPAETELPPPSMELSRPISPLALPPAGSLLNPVPRTTGNLAFIPSESAEKLAALQEELRVTKARLADALTRAPEPTQAPQMDVSDMVLALIDAGYVVRRA